ncbi:MAG: FG-GAP repeat domain-containing protein, partial [Cyclobacteriaceae bacterium]
MLVSGRWAWLFLLASILCSCHQSSKPARFDEVSTNKSIFSTQTSRGIVIGDYDNDGDDDAYIVNADSTEGNRLLRNDGAFVFKDVTEEAKLKALGYSKTAVWFDADNDGWLDLLVGQLTRNRFFHNQGNGKFEEQVSGLEVGRSASALLAADFNGDQWLDVYVCNFMNENSLFINIGFGKFENRIWNSG